MANSSSIGDSLTSWAAEWTHTAICPKSESEREANPVTKPIRKPVTTAAWHILGAGAIGQLLATKYAEAGLDVTLVTRAQLEPIRASLEVRRVHSGMSKTFTLACEPTNFADPIQQLLVTTKSNQVHQALVDIAPRLNGASQIILLHNGMGTLDAAQQQFSPKQIYCATTTEGAYQQTSDSVAGELKTSPRLIYAGEGSTEIGQEGQPSAPRWIQPLLASSLGFSWQYNIEEALWRKLLVNCAINPLTAIHNCRNGELLNNQALNAKLHMVVAELAGIASVVGYQQLADDLSGLVQQVLVRTQDNYASMQQDVLHKRATEIAYITGYLCKQARLKGIAAPINEDLMATVQQLEQAYRPIG